MKRIVRVKNIILSSIFLGGFFFVVHAVGVSAASVDELKQKISERNSEIEKLEQEITQYEKDLKTVSAEAKSLKSTISTLTLSEKKLSTDIEVTENKIDRTNYSIQKIALEIKKKELNIDENMQIIADILRKVDETESNTLLEVMLSNESISTFLDDIDNFQELQHLISQNVDQLRTLKDALMQDKQESEKEKQSLVGYKDDLQDQKYVVASTKKEKDKLLTQTKNKESNYKNILDEKKRLKEEFEKELNDFEAQLRIAIDPNRLPEKGSSVLSWPLTNIVISQYFGNTAFSRSGAYNGKGHNGIDLATPRGTKVYAAAAGTVKGTGNTDEISGCYSYGKWVLVEHENGLSTLYAHLDLIKVREGGIVNTGDLIGYSGNTGYSTGPHLHFTVYASQGVQIVRLGDIKSITNCGNAYIPVAPFDAYLNPIDYLP